jgi:dTDP-glucose 4,6-dehydratase
LTIAAGSICGLLHELLPRSPHPPHELLIVADRPGHDHRYAMDPTKIRGEVGWEPGESLDSRLRKTIG